MCGNTKHRYGVYCTAAPKGTIRGFIMRIGSEERDFSGRSVGGSSGTLGGEQRWKERPSSSPQNQSFFGRSHSPVKTNQSLRLIADI